jgi:hypothetical protein
MENTENTINNKIDNYLLIYLIVFFVLLYLLFFVFGGEKSETWSSTIYLGEKLPPISQSIKHGKDILTFTRDMSPRVYFKILKYGNVFTYSKYIISADPSMLSNLQVALYQNGEFLQVIQDTNGTLNITDISGLELKVLFNGTLLSENFKIL